MRAKNPTTEDIPDQKNWLENLNDDQALAMIVGEQREAIAAIENELLQIKKAVAAITARLKVGTSGRIIYVGAGTSARIGAQDGIELTPTFNWPRERIGYLIAGGEKALLVSVEGAEDDTDAAGLAVEKLNVGNNDVVIALAASGVTPYTVAAVIHSAASGALTVGIANNPETPLLAAAEYPICLATGGEVIAGSTRLKAGTAQKICLNMISTLVMSRLGLTQGGMMTAMVPTSDKLIRRRRLIDEITRGQEQ